MSRFSSSVDLAKMIDRKSFMLGMMTAFGECVAGEVKKCAFSPPFFPDDYYTLKIEAERIAAEMNLHLWLEENAEIHEEHRVMWWVMYKFDEVLAEYQNLRAKGFNPAYEFHRFSELLGYGFAFGENSERVSCRMRETGDTMGTVTRIVFHEGGWPLPPASRNL